MCATDNVGLTLADPSVLRVQERLSLVDDMSVMLFVTYPICRSEGRGIRMRYGLGAGNAMKAPVRRVTADYTMYSFHETDTNAYKLVIGCICSRASAHPNIEA